MCKNYCPYKEKYDVIRAKEEYEKINLGTPIGVTTLSTGLVTFRSYFGQMVSDEMRGGLY